MIKEITLCVPKYVKKFILSEPDYELLSPDTIKVPRLSELGHLIHGFSRTIPYTQPIQEHALSKHTELISIRYNCKKKAFDIPVERYPHMVAFLTEQFRASLIREVSAVHELHSEEDYGWIVRTFLSRRGVVVDDAMDARDMEWERAKKIYRDHLERIQKKNARNRKLSKPVLSGLERVCRV
jgi:hypothetical protein